MTSFPVGSVQLGESATLLDFSWVNIPHRGQRSCVHTGHSARSARGLTAATRMDGLTRPESMWARQSEYDRRPPHLLKPLSSDEQIPAWFEAAAVALLPPCIHAGVQRCTRTRATCYAILRPPVKEIDSMVLERDRESHFAERNTRVKWSNRTPTGHLQTSSDSRAHVNARPWLIINLL